MASLGAISARAVIILMLSVSAVLIPMAAPYELKPKPAEFLNECKRKMGLECGNEINIYLLGRGTPYSDNCCNKLVEMGHECHEGVVVKHLLGKPQDYINKILKKSDRVWSHCVRVLKYRKRHGRRL